MGRTGVTLGFTAVGTAVGAYFGNPMLGAQLGMMAGSIASALIFPGGEDSKGPRLGDLRVADAAYGVPIPLVYGAARVAGTMIWTSGLEERTNEQSQKGGGPTSTTYTYYSSFAIGLCAGPIVGVRKIWLDTKLVYDMSSSNVGIVNQRIGVLDPRALLTEEELGDRQDEIQAELGKVQSALTIYLGSETQLPDPVMESYEGVGNVPAHRGLAYLLFDDLPLEAYGNRIPSISAEVMTASTVGYPKRVLTPTPFELQKDNMVFDAPRQKLWTASWPFITEVDTLNNTVLRTQELDTYYWGGPVTDGIGQTIEVDQDGFLYVALQLTTNGGRILRVDPVSLQGTHVNVHPFTHLPETVVLIANIRASYSYIWATSYGITHQVYCFLRPGAINPQDGQPVAEMLRIGVYTISTSALQLRGQFLCVDRDQRAWVVCSAPTTTFDTRTFVLVMDPTGTGAMIDLSSYMQAGDFIAYDAQTHSVIVSGRSAIAEGVSGQPRVLRLDCETRIVTAYNDVYFGVGYVTSAWHRGVQGRNIWQADGVDELQALDVDSLTVTRNILTTEGYPTPDSVFGGIFDPATNAVWVMEAGAGIAKYYLDRVEATPVTLESIVMDLSQRAGLPPTVVDASALTAEVHGFVVSQRAEARASLETLLGAFLTDGVESDWRLLFRPRVFDPVATLTRDDLAAHEPGSTLPDVLTTERLDDQQLPMRVDVTYADPARDYQDTTQHARRFQAGQRARSERDVRTPVILTADQARDLAEITLHEAWVNRSSYTLSVTYRWATLDPGDVVIVDVDGHPSLMRLQQIQHGANGILDMRAVAYDRHIYTASPSVGAVADAFTAQTLTMIMPTALFLLDTHLLRDVDEGSGYYLAMAPQGGGDWRGATAFSAPDGTSWRMEDTLTTAVDYGSAITALAVGSPYVIDYGHTVDVRMARGVLTSITEAELINGQNAALLGDEIVQWQTVTALDAFSYRLSTLLRGRRGTEWAIGMHRAGERFIVLSPASLRREAMGLSEVGSVRQYRAVSMGTDMLTATSQAFSNTALGLKCYSPDHVHGTRTAGNDLTVTWVRRTRLGGLWVDYRDVPLGEMTGERYEVDVLSGETVVRTLESTTPSVDYLASQQTTDGLTPGDPVTVTVYPLGQLGRGWGTTATV